MQMIACFAHPAYDPVQASSSSTATPYAAVHPAKHRTASQVQLFRLPYQSNVQYLYRFLGVLSRIRSLIQKYKATAFYVIFVLFLKHKITLALIAPQH